MSMSTPAVHPGRRHDRRGDRLLVVVVLAVAGVAWVAMAAMHGIGLPEGLSAGGSHTGHGAPHGHPGPGGRGPGGLVVPSLPAPPGPGAAGPAAGQATGSAMGTGGHRAHGGSAGAWLAGWGVMVIAMMLPPALPLLRVVRRLVAGTSRAAWHVAATAVAFAGVWLAAGALLLLAGAVTGRGLAGLDLVAEHPQLPSGLAAVGAGLYQFTPVKAACLTACRSPVGLAMTTWTGLAPPAVLAARIGFRFGVVCVGCCWALMLLTLVIGVAALPVMLVAAVLMALERVAPQVRDLVPVIAGLAMLAGLAILAGLLPPGLSTV